MASFGGSTIREAFEATEELVTEFSPVQFDEGELSKIHDVTTDGGYSIGLAQESAIVGHPADVIIFGLAKAKIAESCQCGDPLTPDGNGKLRIADVVGDYILGRAASFGSAANDIIMVLVTHEGTDADTGVTSVTQDITRVSAANLTTKQYHFVVLDGSGEVILYDDSDSIKMPLGILQNNPNIGGSATVRLFGISYLYTDGITVTQAGQLITPQNTGKGGDWPYTGHGGTWCAGMALTAPNGSDQIQINLTNSGSNDIYVP
jgi:hypothetical protein